MIHIRGMTKPYGIGDARVSALNGVNIDVRQGEMLAITGPSGCGKSTLLSIMGGLDTADGGKYSFNCVDMRSASTTALAKLRAGSIGCIVQSFALVSDLTVLENIMLPVNFAHANRSEALRRAKSLAKRLGIADKLGAMPNRISGGQAQRAAIARALINHPKLILADEPTGALDTANGRAVIDIFRSINASGQTIVIVTHDERVAASCSRVVKMRDGVILA